MKEAVGNLWAWEPADCRVITTNGYVTNEGLAVMGRGCALEAKEKYPGIDRMLGACITHFGNHAYLIPGLDDEIVSFPVKHHWRHAADLTLIARSVLELAEIVDARGFSDVVMPRPGCGNGRLRWEDVRPLLELHLDDRFTVITF